MMLDSEMRDQYRLGGHRWVLWTGVQAGLTNRFRLDPVHGIASSAG
jgi:hypothetical protein